MNTKQPTIAFTIGMSNSIDGPRYHVYSQAYGMEMQADDEWPINVLMMAPPHLVSSMTKDADLASVGVIPGASYTPGDGNYGQIKKSKGKWVLARPSDDVQRILDEKLGVLLVIEKASELKLLSEIPGLTSDRLIVALQIDSTATIETTTTAVASIRKKLPSGCSNSQILISASFEHANLPDYFSVVGASGLLMLDASFDRILDLIGKLL